jgi:hypothetical protein
MRAIALLCALAVLPGCAAQSVSSISTGGYGVTAVPLTGGAYYSSNVTVVASGSSAWSALAGIALLGFVFHGYENGYWDNGRGFEARQRAPELAPDRAINEQDCSKPIENSLANLRCK